MKVEAIKYKIHEMEPCLVEETKKSLRGCTRHFALRIFKLFAALPKQPVEQVLGKQELRSLTSPVTNYRDAHRNRSDAGYIAKIGDGPNQLLAIFSPISKKVKARTQSA